MGPEPLTPMAKQKQWIGAWSVTGLQAVDGVRRDVDQIALGDGPVLTGDGHDAPAPEHVVELVGRMGVGWT